MNTLGISFLLFTVFFSFHLNAGASSLTCPGFLPENSLSLPPEYKDANMDKQTFLETINKVESVYAPVFEDLGGELVIYKSWASNTVNAYADRNGDKYEVIMYGGMARHKDLTRDGLALVVCHEIGHHLGGAPKKIGNAWSTVEGGADYFATLKCLKKVYQGENHLQALSTEIPVPTHLWAQCQQHYIGPNDQALCVRLGMAGKSVAMVMKDLEWESLEPKFETPDPRVVKNTLQSHPSPQCRLDTYFQGTLCLNVLDDQLDAENPHLGSCSRRNGQQTGLRPLCWFHPEHY